MHDGRRNMSTPLFDRLLEKSGDPGMGVLDLKKPILARLFLGNITSRIRCAVSIFAHQEKKPARVPPPLSDQDFFKEAANSPCALPISRQGSSAAGD